MNWVETVVNHTPGVGHVKGLAQMITGDVEGGKKALWDATKIPLTAAVIIGTPHNTDPDLDWDIDDMDEAGDAVALAIENIWSK